jgi:RimJ/RimL family protein N-acetyltransferase
MMFRVPIPFAPSSIETERLRLRPFERSDLDAVFSIYSRPDVVRYLYDPPRSREEAAALLERKMRTRSIARDGDTASFAIELRSSREVVGDCMVRLSSEAHRQGEIGFVLHPARQGRGYATEAGRELLRIAFEELAVHRVIGRLEARNLASARVLERLGMRREAHLVENEWVKQEWQSELVYAILDREWRAARERPPTDVAAAQALASDAWRGPGSGTEEGGRPSGA